VVRENRFTIGATRVQNEAHFNRLKDLKELIARFHLVTVSEVLLRGQITWIQSNMPDSVSLHDKGTVVMGKNTVVLRASRSVLKASSAKLLISARVFSSISPAKNGRL